MSDRSSQLWRGTLRFRPDIWSAGAVAIAALVLMPVVAVLWMAFHPTENIWPHLMSTTLPRYVQNTVVLDRKSVV